MSFFPGSGAECCEYFRGLF